MADAIMCWVPPASVHTACITRTLAQWANSGKARAASPLHTLRCIPWRQRYGPIVCCVVLLQQYMGACGSIV